jgi:hypothetical protein
VGHNLVSFYQCCNQPFLEPITCACVLRSDTENGHACAMEQSLCVKKKNFFDSSVHVHCVFQIFIWNLLDIICVIIREQTVDSELKHVGVLHFSKIDVLLLCILLLEYMLRVK